MNPTLTITMNLAGEAFSDAPSEEVARILTKYAERLRHDDQWYMGTHLLDINGNIIGSATLGSTS